MVSVWSPLVTTVTSPTRRTRCYEPDGPNYTPRISGVVDQDGSFCLSILKSADGDPACSHRYFYEYDAPLAGEGRFIHTYQENAEPLPSFEGEPRRVSVSAPDAETLASQVWASLNEETRCPCLCSISTWPPGSVRPSSSTSTESRPTPPPKSQTEKKRCRS